MNCLLRNTLFLAALMAAPFFSTGCLLMVGGNPPCPDSPVVDLTPDIACLDVWHEAVHSQCDSKTIMVRNDCVTPVQILDPATEVAPSSTVELDLTDHVDADGHSAIEGNVGPAHEFQITVDWP